MMYVSQRRRWTSITYTIFEKLEKGVPRSTADLFGAESRGLPRPRPAKEEEESESSLTSFGSMDARVRSGLIRLAAKLVGFGRVKDCVG